MALEERLRLIVDAATGTAEASFGKLTTSAERTATAVDVTAESVAAAADRVAQARNRQADAAGKLAVAEARLTEAQARYGEGSSQVVAAEERVASAQRQVQVASSGVTSALEAQAAAQSQATESAGEGADASEEAGRGAERLKDEIGGLKESVVGLVAGLSLADWVQESVTGFLEGARGAYSLAKAMNASVAEGGRLAQMFSAMGLEADDLLEIQAEFAGTTKDGLTAIGTELAHNADGTVNWANTITETLGELQKIPDATERNAQGFAMFGEEGYKQLSALVNSSTDVADALDQIGFPITEEDVAATQAYDSAMMRLSLTSGNLGRTVGRALVPILTDAIDGFDKIADVVTSIPGPIALAVVAAIALGVTGFQPLAFAAEKASLAITAARVQLLTYSEAATAAGVTSRLGAAGMAAMSAAGAGASKALALVGGPLGVALLAAGAAYYFASSGAEDLASHAKDAAAALEQTEDPASSVNTTMREQVRLMQQNAGSWETYQAVTRGAMVNTAAHLNGFEAALVGIGSQMNVNFGVQLSNWLSGGDAAAAGFEGAISQAREELGEFGAQQAAAQLTTADLNTMIAEGDTSSQAFADAVRDAAAAQAEETATSDTAKAAIDAYHASTDGAVQAVYDMMAAQYASQDANFAFLNAMDEAATTTDDAKTSVDEARQAQVKLGEAALAAAGQAADAAVAQAKAAGQIVTPLDEARIRATTMVDDLRAKLNTPGLTETSKAELQGLIDQLTTAQEKGDVNALVTLTGVEQAQGQIAGVTADQTATVTVESRGGPAVQSYLDGIANAQRLAIVRVESRNGPAVDDYLNGLSVGRDRLAIVRVESRNGPAVDAYLDSLRFGNDGADRLAIIRVETRGGPAVARYLDDLAGASRTATINVGRGAPGPGAYGAPSLAGAQLGRVAVASVSLDLELTGTVDRGQLSKAQRGRARVEEIRAYERENGTGWRR